MRTIDLQSWPRKDQFSAYRQAHFPHFNLCAEVDMTVTHRAAKQRGIPITAAILYVTARAANDIPEFRYRIKGDTVVEHDVVHPASTVLVNGDLFSFCFYDYTDDFAVFVQHYDEMTAWIKSNPTLDDPSGRDDLLFMTAIPWVSFTSFMHPILTVPVDSIPRLAWGRFHRDDDAVKMPLSVQGHHSLMDGLHVGRFYERVQEYLANPEGFMNDH